MENCSSIIAVKLLVKFYPYKKGGGGIVFSHSEGRSTTSFEVVLTRELEVLAIVMGVGGGHKTFPPFKRGGGHKKFYSILRWGGQTFLDSRFSHYVATPPPRNY